MFNLCRSYSFANSRILVSISRHGISKVGNVFRGVQIRNFAKNKRKFDDLFKKWRPEFIEKAKKEDILSGFLNLPGQKAEECVSECMKILVAYKEDLGRINSQMMIDPPLISKLKVKKDNQKMTIGAVAKVGLNEDGNVRIISSDPSFTQYIHNSIVISIPGLNPVKESDVILNINSQSLTLDKKKVGKQLKLLFDTNISKIHKVSNDIIKSSYDKKASIDVNNATRKEIDEFCEAIKNVIKLHNNTKSLELTAQ